MRQIRSVELVINFHSNGRGQRQTGHGRFGHLGGLTSLGSFLHGSINIFHFIYISRAGRIEIPNQISVHAVCLPIAIFFFFLDPLIRLYNYVQVSYNINIRTCSMIDIDHPPPPITGPSLHHLLIHILMPNISYHC